MQPLGLDSPRPPSARPSSCPPTDSSSTRDSKFELRQQKLEVTVAGVFEIPAMGFGADGPLILAPQHILQQFPGSNLEFALERLRRGKANAGWGTMRAHVHVERIDDLENIEQQIQAMGFETRNFVGDVEQVRTMFLIIDSLLLSVGFVALVVAGLGIVNTLLMTVLERFREIGLYKALGASSGDVRLIFLAEAGVVGVGGGIGGIFLGLLVSWILRLVLDDVAQRQGLTAEIARFDFPAWLLLGAIVFSIAVSISSALYPSSRAARTDPIQALRSQ